jgi:hypothetical protein
MGRSRAMEIDRRAAMFRIGAGAAALTPVSAFPAAAELPPEITSVRLPKDVGLCQAAQFLTEDFLRLEGFTEISYAGWGDITTENQVLHENKADFVSTLGSEQIASLDRGWRIVVPYLGERFYPGGFLHGVSALLAKEARS